MDELAEPTFEKRDAVLIVDAISRDHLAEAARWAKFLAVMGFIGCVILVVAGIIMSVLFSYIGALSTKYSHSGISVNPARMSSILGVIYILISVILFFRYLFLYRFADKMKSGLRMRSQDQINESFKNLKKMFRYAGIITIIGVLCYIIFFIAGAIMALSNSN